jgi:hypothetical protein
MSLQIAFSPTEVLRMTDRILLIGGASSGKTHFGAQLLARLQRGSGTLRFRDTPTNVALFQSVLQRLGQGLCSDHTGSDVYGEVLFPVQSTAHKDFDLVWPDYAGEQIENIADLRTLTSHWTERILQSTHWILMVRPMLAPTPEDLLNRPSAQVPLNSATANVQLPATQIMSKQTHLVELLQILRHAKGINSLTRTQSPKMLVLLSCWDELGQNGTLPSGLLKKRLPMLDSYLHANWNENSLLIYGLSALERTLSQTEVDPEYQDRGPESFGYVISPSGAQDRDLTLPIATLAL